MFLCFWKQANIKINSSGDQIAPCGMPAEMGRRSDESNEATTLIIISIRQIRLEQAEHSTTTAYAPEMFQKTIPLHMIIAPLIPKATSLSAQWLIEHQNQKYWIPSKIQTAQVDKTAID